MDVPANLADPENDHARPASLADQEQVATRELEEIDHMHGGVRSTG
jgi:hypothetical protein